MTVSRYGDAHPCSPCDILFDSSGGNPKSIGQLARTVTSPDISSASERLPRPESTLLRRLVAAKTSSGSGVVSICGTGSGRNCKGLALVRCGVRGPKDQSFDRHFEFSVCFDGTPPRGGVRLNVSLIKFLTIGANKGYSVSHRRCSFMRTNAIRLAIATWLPDERLYDMHALSTYLFGGSDAASANTRQPRGLNRAHAVDNND